MEQATSDNQKFLLRVCMRRDVDSGQISAVWRDRTGSNTGLMCYAHVGQHSECSYSWYASTRLATAPEYEALRAELAQRYGACKVVLRMNRTGALPI